MSALKNLLPKRTKFSNKTDGGKVLIIGGGKGLYGAGILAALAATRSGAGYTHLMTDLSKFSWLKFPDFIVHPLKLSELKNKEAFSIGIGPGLGTSSSKKKMIEYLIKHNYQNVVVDADALTIIATHHIMPLPSTWILTPHEGELARLLKIKPNQIKKNRKLYLQAAVAKFQCTILIKGFETLILSHKEKKIHSIKKGTPALSKAGTGDVLLGMITAFRAQGLTPTNACVLAVSAHGLSAKTWEEEGQDHLSLRPTDLIDRLPQVLLSIRKL